MEENMSFIEMLFDADNLVDFMSKMDYINAIFDYDEYIINELTENLKTLETDKAALLVAEENQQKSVAELEEINKQNQELHDSKLEYINSLVSDENSLVEEYSYYKQLEDEMNYELESYLEELAARQARQNTVYVGGSIWWPLDNSVRYYVSSEYGWRNLYGMQDFHLGIDLACANGTTVLAANSGTVLRSEYHWSYGNYVLIDHGGGISTLYAHMSSAAVSQGDTVEAGQTIGWVGLTGNTFGYHLHFETRENGSTVNPRNYLAFP